MTITLSQITLAYRKAKVDLYYSVDPREIDLLHYEENLDQNLRTLLDKVNSGDFGDRGWLMSPEFVGSYSVVPKKIQHKPGGVRPTVMSSNPDQHIIDLNEPPSAIFRIISQCSIGMHVLSTLWLMTVGDKLDSTLSVKSMGNRLRRQKDGQISTLSLGSFRPYLGPFRQWREGGLEVIDRALDLDKKVTAVTGDVKSFYHKLDPDFLVDPDYLKEVLGVTLTEDENRINHLFVDVLGAWECATKESLQQKRVGLPVGLPASAVVANMALVEFDRYIEKQVTPLYYSRYVDDIFLVVEEGVEFDTPRELWTWIIAREANLGLKSSDEGIVFAPKYLDNSEVQFHNEKNKVFRLEGSTGKALIASVRRALYEQGSEWRSLPQLPSSTGEIGTRMVVAMQPNGDPVDNLHKADTISAKRAKFALQLRDFESFQRDLPLDEWSSYRQAFFNSVADYVLTIEGFFELWTYLPRILRLALVCEEFGIFADILKCLSKLTSNVEKFTVPEVASLKLEPDTVAAKWRAQLDRVIKGAIATTSQGSGFPNDNQKEIEKALSAYGSYDLIWWILTTNIEQLSERLFLADLGHTPLRYSLLPTGISPHAGLLVNDCPELTALTGHLPPAVALGRSALERLFPSAPGELIARAVFYPTRPFNMMELFIAGHPFRKQTPKSVARSMEHIADVVRAVRGFVVHDYMPHLERTSEGVLISVRDDKRLPSGRRNIAIGALETLDSQSERAAGGNPDLGLARYRRLIALVNDLILNPRSVDYLVLPELSLPPRWFVKIAQKLDSRGISLLAGMEYIHSGGSETVSGPDSIKRKNIQNEVWLSLHQAHLGYPSSVIYRQDKQKAAPGEMESLSRLAGLRVKPQSRWLTPPVIMHGEFAFAIIVCSDLTNVDYRSSLRGRVDTVFVPEWNRDLHTFEALVESAALDIHAYIVQANNRRYGDSRIRVPAVNEWDRDVVRHRGGMHDYNVVGEVDFKSLRRHQSVVRAANSAYKPLPDGFVIAPNRYSSPPLEE